LLNVLELYEFEEEGMHCIYWNVNYPWPMSNRDVSFELLFSVTEKALISNSAGINVMYQVMKCWITLSKI